MPEPSSDLVRRYAVASLLAITAIVGLALVANGPAWFLRLGDRSFSLDLARDLFGDDVPVPLDDRHDGEWFWNLARDPLLRDEAALEDRLDRPVYRAQRIGYPLLAAPWKVLGETALLYGLLITNVVGIALGTVATAALVRRLRCPPMTVVAFAFTPVVLIAAIGDLPDALAAAALLGMLVAARDDRVTAVAVLSVAAVLFKESSFAGLAGLALLAPGLSRRVRVAAIVPGALAGALWAGYVRLRLDDGGRGVEEFDAVPFRGLIDTWDERWVPSGREEMLLSALLLLAASAVVVVRLLRRRTPELAMALPFAVLTPFLTPQVLDLPINSFRSVGPMFTLLALDLLRGRAGDAPRVGSPSLSSV